MFCYINIPLKHTTMQRPPQDSKPMEARCLSATRWHGDELQVGPLEGLERHASCKPTLCSPDSLL